MSKIYQQEEKALRAQSSRYKGQHIMVIADKIFTAKTGQEAKKLWRKLRKQYPEKMPLVAYIPKTDCSVYKTSGIGGDEVVYLLNKTIKAKIGNMIRHIPLGFLNHNNVPPIFGRQEFLESLKVIFYKHITTFAE